MVGLNPGSGALKVLLIPCGFSLAAPVASFDWAECVSFDGLATCPECIGACVCPCMCMWDWVCACICVYFFWTETELRSRLLAEFEAKWISISPMSAPFTVTARWHGTVWRPRPTWCPPSPRPPPPIQASQQSVTLSKWSQKQADTWKVFWVFILRLRARWLSTKVVLEGTVSSSGYGNNYLLHMNKTVIVKHDPLPEEYCTIFWFFFH